MLPGYLLTAELLCHNKSWNEQHMLFTLYVVLHCMLFYTVNFFTICYMFYTVSCFTLYFVLHYMLLYISSIFFPLATCIRGQPSLIKWVPGNILTFSRNWLRRKDEKGNLTTSPYYVLAGMEIIMRVSFLIINIRCYNEDIFFMHLLYRNILWWWKWLHWKNFFFFL